ncbi:MAG: NAD(P)-binding domain-containing protein [Bdellovibrionales bacterium]|nr:NAD(P)-binding domain-containing protein [Bdellovibrionales bacterium]
MNIVVLGAGRFGGALTRALVQVGYSVRVGVRTPSKPEVAALVQETGVFVGSPAEALGPGKQGPADAVFLAVPWPAAWEVAESLAPALSGKVLVDCTNAIDRNGLVLRSDTSAAEEIAKAAPGARVVKAFNAVGAELLAQPVVSGQKAHVLIASDDEGARAFVEEVTRALGFLPQAAGPLENARLVEAMALLWIRMSFQSGLGPRAAMRVLK